MSKIIDFDKLATDFDVKVKAFGREIVVIEPTMSMVEKIAKMDGLEESEHIPIIKEFVSKSLPDVSEEEVSKISLRQAKALIEGVMEEFEKDPIEAAEAS